MRVEKKLKEEVRLTDEKITESGKELKAALIKEYCLPSNKTVTTKPFYKKKSSLITMSCILMCLIIVGIGLSIFLNKDKPIHYLKENEVSNDTTLESIYGIVDIQINDDNYVVAKPTIFKDRISDDILYYRVNVDSKNVFPYGEVFFITNKNYVLYDTDYELVCTWEDNQVSYDIRATDNGGIPILDVTGRLEYKQLRIYFSYTDIDLGEPVTPTSFLDSLFK